MSDPECVIGGDPEKEPDTVPVAELLICGHAICRYDLSQLRQATCPICRKPLMGPTVTPDVLRQIESREAKDRGGREDEGALTAQVLSHRRDLTSTDIYNYSEQQLRDLLKTPSVASPPRSRQGALGAYPAGSIGALLALGQAPTSALSTPAHPPAAHDGGLSPATAALIARMDSLDISQGRQKSEMELAIEASLRDAAAPRPARSPGLPQGYLDQIAQIEAKSQGQVRQKSDLELAIEASLSTAAPFAVPTVEYKTPSATAMPPLPAGSGPPPLPSTPMPAPPAGTYSISATTGLLTFTPHRH